ncbi:sensor histidine kinase [Fodinibius sp. SL11]|uniref:sensor histidine kinase n=1 Tax=Fodinibius sp. SL11 TaxID=3425690 RepID=UPI003F885D4D
MGLQDDVTDIIALDRKLSDVEEERKVLISEVHHRVKNNLAVMSSLMELEQSSDQQNNVLEKGKLQIDSMATVHEKLYQKEGFAYLNLTDFIEDLRNSELVNAGQFDLDLEYDFALDNVEVNINQAIPLSIIVSELIENVYRHAYPAQLKGRISIKLIEDDNGVVTIGIVDFGKGFPENIDIFASGTIGFTVINTLLAQLGAEAEIIKGDEIGFGIRIRFQKSDDPGSSQHYRILSNN